MTPYYRDKYATIYHGDALAVLRDLPDESVQCCVTSPPYWGLRDYGVEGQLGLEPTPEEYVTGMADVFREVRRVLRDDGTLWLNLGDSYMANIASQAPQTKQHSGSGHCGPNRQPQTGLKPKDLVGIPWRVAFALQADGWYLRQDIIWKKPNPMPESVTDRCTKAHEYLFILSKSARYYYDAEAIKEDCVQDERRPSFRGGAYVNGSTFNNSEGGNSTDVGNIRVGSKRRASAKRGTFNGKTEAMADTGQNAFRAVTETRNKRSVWTVATQPYKEAHFATFPPKLIEPCILAGCPAGGTVLDPFGGSGTTAWVAKSHNRKSVTIELNAEYLPMMKKRLSQGVLPLFTEEENA